MLRRRHARAVRSSRVRSRPLLPKSPGGGRGLTGASVASLLALPGAVFLFFAIDFDLCLDNSFIM
jgi:hypothetical protein